MLVTASKFTWVASAPLRNRKGQVFCDVWLWLQQRVRILHYLSHILCGICWVND